MANEKNRYVQLIESIFLKYYYEGSMEFTFKREDIVEMADKLGIKLPKNLGMDADAPAITDADSSRGARAARATGDQPG
jgi:hypothetical protein